jgi:hypothetical protein
MRSFLTVAVLFLATSLLSPLSAQVPRGPDFLVGSTTAGAQFFPRVAMAANGDFVVVWQSGFWSRGETPHVWARLFKADGTPKGREFRVTDVQPREANSAIAMEPDGDFIVVWQGGNLRDSSVFGRRFTARGKPVGARFRLSQATEESQSEPAVAFQPDGSFVVAWTQGPKPELGAGIEVYTRRFAADGTPASSDLLVATDTFPWEDQHNPQVGVSANGDFVVGWLAYGGESTFHDVLARRFDASGAPLGEVFVANSGETIVGNQDEFALAALDSGELVVVWTDSGADSDLLPPPFEGVEGILGQRFAADGSRLGSLFHVNSIAPSVQHGPSISPIPGGGFFVVWVSELPAPQKGSVLYGRRFARNGAPFGREVQISGPAATGSQAVPAVAVGPNGRGVVVWASRAQGSLADETVDVFARRLVLRR